jgi:hypothetical protein
MTGAFPPSIELARKTSARGTRHMVGRLGLARITLLPGDSADYGSPAFGQPPVRPDSASLPDDGVDDLWRGVVE